MPSPQIIDISPMISEKLAVFPGDKAFCQQTSLSFKNSDHLELSSIEGTLHLGAHADAPSHYRANGSTIEAQDLEIYLGPCQVLTASGQRDLRVFPEHFPMDLISAERVLIRTNSYPDPNSWTDEFWGLSAELVEELSKKGVKLIGIDTPSVDPSQCKKLITHNKIADFDIRILEGLVLSDEVLDKETYELVALPLKIKGAEASPVRAVLRKQA